MTIQVRIYNNDPQREVELVERSIDRSTGRVTESTIKVLKGGANTVEYVHLLRELVVREVLPSPQIRSNPTTTDAPKTG